MGIDMINLMGIDMINLYHDHLREFENFTIYSPKENKTRSAGLRRDPYCYTKINFIFISKSEEAEIWLAPIFHLERIFVEKLLLPGV